MLSELSIYLVKPSYLRKVAVCDSNFDMARHIVQLILTSTRILCRAFVKSVQEEIRAAQEASKKQTINRYTEAGTGVKSFRGKLGTITKARLILLSNLLRNNIGGG